MQTEYYVVYELYKDTKNGVSLPDAYNIRKISAEFQVSSDYILGLTDEIESKYPAQDVTLLFKRYKHMKLNPILKDEEYYWIKLEVNEDRTYTRSTQTECAGFTEDGKEIRVARKVIPEKVIELCNKMGDSAVIINKISEIGLLYLFGGNAIITETLCKEHMPNVLEPMIK